MSPAAKLRVRRWTAAGAVAWALLALALGVAGQLLVRGDYMPPLQTSGTAGVVVVSLASGANGHAIASSQPDPDEIVTVLAEPPVTIAFAALTTIDAEEGTPVLDGDGELIGLCSQRHGAGDDQPITLIDVTGDPSLDEQHGVATTIAP